MFLGKVVPVEIAVEMFEDACSCLFFTSRHQSNLIDKLPYALSVSEWALENCHLCIKLPYSLTLLAVFGTQ